MHWWHGAFASSSSSSKSHADDDSVIRYSSSSSSSSKSSFFSSRRNRHLQRARRLLGVTDDMCNFENSQNAREFAASPQPLPLPELHVLLRQDPKFASSNVPLPSPRDAVPVQREKGGYEDREREDGLNGDIADGFYEHMSRLADQDTRTNAQYSESQFSGKSSFKRNGYERTSDRYKTHFPSSAPSSPYSSPALSPPRSDMLANHYMPPPGIFQAWSAPDMRHSDGNQGPSSYYHLPPERTSSSVEDSPIQSPTMSSSHQHPASPPRSSSPLSRMSFETSVSSGHQHSASPPRSISPLSTKVSSETSMGRRESSSQATVHPLPLPPGAAMSSQTTPISPVSDFSGANIPSQPASVSPVASKPELVPMKSQWQKGKLIGRGTFMSVYVASNRETGALCAMKEVEILPDDSKYAENMRHLEQEIKVLSRLKHPNIVQYFGSEIVGDKFYIYLEYVHPGSINKFIQDHCGAITESVVRNFTRHILCGLAYLHSKKTIHRDIKGANLLVDAYGVVKLADFGMAKHLSGQAADLSLKGSPYWLAPELLQSVMQKDTSSDVALAVDIWSLGCTIIEMMNGKPPWSEYEGAAALFKVLQETPPIPESLSADGKDFLQRCFRRNPADRPTASQLLDHPFLNYSNQADACTQSLPDMRLLENMQLLRDRSNQTSDQVPASFDTQIKNGKPSHNFTRDSFYPVRLQ